MAGPKDEVPPPVAVFVDPVHMLAAIHPLLALAALSPSAAVVAASNLMDLFSPAQNPVAALVAFQLGWEWASRLAAGQDPQASRSGPGRDPAARGPRAAGTGPGPADPGALLLAAALAATRGGMAPLATPLALAAALRALPAAALAQPAALAGFPAPGPVFL